MTHPYDIDGHGGLDWDELEASAPTHRSIPIGDPTSFTAPADAHPSSQKFYAVLAEAAKLHDKKQRDYGSDADPFANVRASEDFGIPAWLGCIIRGNDKVRRIQSFATRGELANESIEDALIDLLVYAGIALVLYRESL
jgi:hypothetical protein